MTLVDFLLARIAEDEAELTEPTEFNRRAWSECEAKRQIIEAYSDLVTTCDHQPRVNLGGVCQCGIVAHGLIALAGVNADHPDYREEWRP